MTIRYYWKVRVKLRNGQVSTCVQYAATRELAIKQAAETCGVSRDNVISAVRM